MSHTSNIKTNPDACPLAKKCGGCQLQNMSYERQLRWKQARCEILLKKFGKKQKQKLHIECAPVVYPCD